MPESLTFAPTPDPRRVRAPDGRVLSVPEGWALLPPGDAGLTRRVKAAGPTWTVVEKVGRKLFSRGVWAPEPHIHQARAALESERATPAYAKKLAAGRDRRAREQEQYEVDFANAVLRFLAFSPAWVPHGKRLAVLVAAHATPVGSGTVARTERIPVERRAEAAVIAWMRHQTTSYDNLKIARVKGARREVRRELAEISRAVLDLHRRDVPHGPTACPLCTALMNVGAGARQG
ncbi:DUF2293 domain-containing protein [Myxococcus sp. AM011]|uniref:DUF2293 domain-containing protein n=1 Tax=Myxococcus sp. AM011 TaxID=2745200 RepID=UPI001594EB7A|nr:DUF2293 domain-containing protein [Myxococcus sp. AM011]NVJ24199.1 DUF2293 domain-containing protein [Myxococcus sp. AM011]